MFSHILKIKKDGTNQIEQRIRQNVSQSAKIDEKSISITNSSIKPSEFTQKKPQQKQVPKRLKLKDYMRLNQISKEKRSRSAQYMKIESKQKLNKNYELNIRETSAKADLKEPVKKSAKSYSEQASLQRFQLMKQVQKIKDKFNRIMILIQETTQKFSTYNDLVFMFRIEEFLNDYVKKGINKITDSYKEYLLTNPIEGIDKKAIDLRLQRMFTVRNTQQPQKNDFQVDQAKIVSLKNFQDQKQDNFGILPVSIGLHCPNKQFKIQNAHNSIKKSS